MVEIVGEIHLALIKPKFSGLKYNGKIKGKLKNAH
jgi:hypothetical protein